MNLDSILRLKDSFYSSKKTLFGSKPDDRKILNLVPDAVIGCCKNGTIIHWDEQSEKIFGWKASEVIGQSIAETIIPLEYRALHINGMKRMVETNESRVINKFLDLTALHKEGKKIPIEMVIRQTFNKKEPYFYSFIRESSQKRNLQTQLEGLSLNNKILQLILKSKIENKDIETSLKSYVGELAQQYQSQLAIVFESGKDYINLCPDMHNQTGIDNTDFTKPLTEDIKLFSNKLDTFDNHQIQWSENTTIDRSYPFFNFSRNFGFKGWFNIPILNKNAKTINLSFFSLEKLHIDPMQLKSLSEIKENIEASVKTFD